MIIIIEGPDGAGKTTLASRLSEQTKYPVVHHSSPKTEEEKQNMLGEYLHLVRANKNLIIDRCWYSEMVYGPVMRGSSIISYPDMYLLEEALAKAGAIIIYATGPKAALWQRCQKRGEEFVTCRNDFNAICDGFEVLMSVPHIIPVLKYECKGMS